MLFFFIDVTLLRCNEGWRNFCPTDICPTDICPTVRPRPLSDPRTHRHLSNPRLKMRHLSDLYINRTFVRPRHLSNLTFVRPKAKKWHLSDLDVCPSWHLSNQTLKCLSANLSVRLFVCLSVRPSVHLPFLLFCTSSNPLSEWRLDAWFRS